MRVFDSTEVRNAALMGHGHCGKTSVASAMLFTSGATDRLGNPDEGTALTDFDEEEIARKLSISPSLAAIPWHRVKINLIDTPGSNIFLNESRSALAASDAVILVLDGVAGIEVSTHKVWQFAQEFDLPTALFVNKLDRPLSSFENAVSQAQEAYGRAVVPITLPIGSEKSFSGIIDLIHMQALTYAADGKGNGTPAGIPADLQDSARQAHEALVEMIAEGDDALLEEFVATGTLPVEHIVSGLHEAVRTRRIFPVLCGSAAQNIGADYLMEFVSDIFPSPLESNAHTIELDGTHSVAHVVDQGQPSLYVFKSTVDPFAGRLTYFKVMSGTLKDDITLMSPVSNTNERLAHIAAPFGKDLQSVTELHAGDIGVVPKLKNTHTGDTLCEKSQPASYHGIATPEPSFAYAISAKKRADEDRLSAALTKMLEEDRLLRFYRDPQTNEFLLAGSGQQHLEIVVSRLKRRYGVEVELKAPKVPYRESIRTTASAQGRHKKQTGGHGQFGDCWIKLEPLERGKRFEFVNQIFGGAIPKTYVPAVEKGILDAAEQGFLAGFPVVDFRATVYDGSYHDVDSSEMAFRLAGRKAFRAAMQQARPALLEPVLHVTIETPPDFAGDLISDLNGRRGRVERLDMQGAMQIINALVPMAEMLNYNNELISMTQGRASFHMDFDHYDYVPAAQAAKVIDEAKAGARPRTEDDD